jgi:hypothetical protein
VLRGRARHPLALVSGLLLVVGALAWLPETALASCGVWRWDVKTLSDPARKEVNFNERRIKVNKLRHLDPPSSLSTDTPRLNGIEKQVFEIRAQVITAAIEDDGDIHLVIASRTARAQQMIVEFPDPKCVASPFKRDHIAHARQAMLNNCGSISSGSFTDLSGNVIIRGVGFWDEDHGQKGVAPNAIELHPVLGFTGNCSRVSGGGGGGGGGGGPRNCTAGYSPCLVYHGGADYDCYGGGGDGPYYTEPGVVYTVTGSDPYRLDGDNDGLGCE